MSDEKQLIDFKANVSEKGVIDNNIQEFILNVKERCKAYEGLTFTEETLKDAKKTRAELNEAIKFIDTRRKAVHEEYEKPYNEFANAVKIAVQEIITVKHPIELQISKFEAEQDNKKTEVILNLYKSILAEKDFADDVKDFINKVLDNTEKVKPCYLNTTYTESKIKKEIVSLYDSIRTDYVTIKNLCSKDDELLVLALDSYIRNGLEYGAGVCIDRAQQEIARRAEVANMAKVEPKKPITQEAVTNSEPLPVKVKHLWFKLNKNQFEGLKTYCSENGIILSDKEIVEG